MPAQFFYLPLPNHAGLIEIQAYLRTLYGDSIALSDPALFHITLVHVPDAPESLTAIQMPPIPVFGMGGYGFQHFRGDDGRTAVTVSVEPNPQLIHLQASIFYAVQGLGHEVSPYSWPGLYRPHVTLGYIEREPDYQSMPGTVYMQAERVVLSGEGYTSLAEWPLRVVTPEGAPVREMSAYPDVVTIGEFRGSYPTVPIYPDVNIAALTQGDDDPEYVVLPVAKSNSVSSNKRFYSADVVRVIGEQMRARRPVGDRGHPESLDRTFANPAVYWIGDAMVDDTLWGKAYVPPGEVREMVRRMKETRSEISTSILAMAESEWNQSRNLWMVQARGFDLLQIDLAPAYRAGIRDLKAIPHLTKEMSFTKGTGVMEEKFDRLAVIRELSAADAGVLPEAVRDAVLKSAPSVAVVQTLSEMLGGENIVEMVKAIVSERDSLRHAVIGQEITAQVAEMVKVPSARGMVQELVVAAKPESKDKVKAVVESVLQRESVAEMLKAATVAAGGPAQHRPQATETAGSGMLKAKPERAKK